MTRQEAEKIADYLEAGAYYTCSVMYDGAKIDIEFSQGGFIRRESNAYSGDERENIWTREEFIGYLEEQRDYREMMDNMYNLPS